MKDETGQPLICVHCGAQAISFDRLAGLPICAKQVLISIFRDTGWSMGRAGMEAGKTEWLQFSQELARRYSEPATREE